MVKLRGDLLLLETRSVETIDQAILNSNASPMRESQSGGKINWSIFKQTTTNKIPSLFRNSRMDPSLKKVMNKVHVAFVGAEKYFIILSRDILDLLTIPKTAFI